MLKLTFADVLGVPQYSGELISRSQVDISTNLGFGKFKIPILSSPMTTVTGKEMLWAMDECGGFGFHHRYNVSENELIKAAYTGGIAVSPSMGTKFIEKLTEQVTWPVVILDVAHGNTRRALDYAEFCVKQGCDVISGNICTIDAAWRYYNIGVNLLRIGVGSGAACSTRVVTGHGFPQWAALEDIRTTMPDEVKLISDGGHNSSGDVVKALYYADAVILGRLLAGTKEAPPKRKFTLNYRKYNGFWKQSYAGMASKQELQRAGKEVRPEGVAGHVPYQGSVKDVLDELVQGIKDGFAYAGAENLKEFQRKAQFIRITQNVIAEGRPRI